MAEALGSRQISTTDIIVLPTQYFGQARVSQGEQKLLLALLEGAWNDLALYLKFRSKHAQHIAMSAWDWIQSGDTGQFSFNDTCDHLGLSSSKMRKGMERAMEKRGALHSLIRSRVRSGSEKMYV